MPDPDFRISSYGVANGAERATCSQNFRPLGAIVPEIFASLTIIKYRILHVLKEICMAIVVEVVVVAMKAVNLQSYMPQRACLMGRPSKNGLEERMNSCTGKWVLNIGEDMHTDSARYETF